MDSIGFEDSLWIVSIIFGLGLFFLFLVFFAGQVLPEVDRGLNASGSVDSDVITSQILTDAENSTNRFNLWFPFLLIGLFAFVLISALFIQSHPAFFFIGLVFLGVTIIVGAVYANVYQDISDNSAFTDAASNVGIITLIVKYLPYIATAIFLLIGFMIWVNKSGGATGGL